jgi:hypothetical protein
MYVVRVFIVSLTMSERATDTEAVIVLLAQLCQEYFTQIRVRLTYGMTLKLEAPGNLITDDPMKTD